MGGMVTLSADVVVERISSLRNDLIDITLRNRLVDMGEGCTACMGLIGTSPAEIYRELALRNGSFVVRLGTSEGDASRSIECLHLSSSVGNAKVSSSLMSMYSKAQEVLDAQGVRVLFLAMGSLEWSSDGTQGRRARSPLLLLPVRVTRPPSSVDFELWADGPVLLNPVLEHKLRTEMSLSLPPLSEGVVDVDGYFQELRDLFTGKGWDVTSAAHLGLFELPHMAVHDEFAKYQDMMVAHPVIRVIAQGKGAPDECSGSREAVDAEAFSVLDADSSQREAVSLMLSGTSFVLQGPPGTGKSQTIVNMITEEIARGRKVLFVSEKRYALDTVRKRMETRGLGRYCLDLYDPQRDVREVADELGRCLSSLPSSSTVTFSREEMEQCRKQLDGYVEALHQVREGLGMSFHEVLSRLTELRSVAEVSLGFPGLERMSARYLESLQPLVKDLEKYAPLLETSETHPWADCEVGKWQLSAQSEIMRRLSDLKLSRTRLEEVIKSLCEEYDLPVPRDLKGTNELTDHLRAINLTHYPEESWLISDPAPLLELVEDIQESYRQRLERMTWVKQMYRDGVLDLDLKGMQERALQGSKMTTRLFDHDYRRDMKALESLKRGNRKLKHAQACFELKELVEVSDLISHIQKDERDCAERLGRHFQGDKTDWAKTVKAIEWTREYRAKNGVPQTPGITRLLCSGPDALEGLKTKIDSLDEAAQRLSTAVSAVRERFDLSPLMNGRSVSEVPFQELNDWAQNHLDHATSFQEWTEVVRIQKEARESGLEDLLILASAGKLSPESTWEGVRKRHLMLWHDLLLSRDDRLRLFDRETHERRAARFAELDLDSLEAATSQTRRALERHRGDAFRSISEQSEEQHSIPKSEVSGIGQRGSLGGLFASALDHILAIKPCLMMSPRAVTALLDPTTALFDLLILDEASQMRVEDGIASMLRAKQVVVVGDSMQLPPMDLATGAEGAIAEGRESIMDACSGSLPQRSLLWHYRSRQESLFAFSNERFYGGRLITYPSATLDREDLGVSFVHVPGAIGEEGRCDHSEAEAKKVVDLVLEHVGHRSRDSLGVVAFTETQQVAILAELERRTAQDPALAPLLTRAREESFFVKSLDAVQGDERDVIIISVGHCKDRSGRMFRSLGLLKGEMGRRRLNVAVTRARKHIKLVSSLLPEEIETDANGRDVLRDYLEYAAWPGHEVENGASSGARDPIADDVRERLEERGLKVERDVGMSSGKVDLAIVDDEHPGRYLLGILTDGRSYRKAGGARDRDRLRQEVLTNLGWILHRLWSQDWLSNPQAEVERIVAAVEMSRTAHAEKEADEEMRPLEVLVASLSVVDMAGASDAPNTLTVDDGIAGGGWSSADPEVDGTVMTSLSAAEEVDLSAEGGSISFNSASEETELIVDEVPAAIAAEPDTRAVSQGLMAPDEPLRDLCAIYSRARLHEDPSLVYLFAQDQEAAMREAAIRVVEEEGPVHMTVVRDRVKELVAVSTGKRPSNVDRLIRPAIGGLEEESRIRIEGDFLWPADLRTLRPRRCYSPRRDIDHVCDAEMEAMVRMITARTPNIRVKRVVNDVSDLLGYKRPTAAIKKRVERTLATVAPSRTRKAKDIDDGRMDDLDGFKEGS